MTEPGRRAYRLPPAPGNPYPLGRHVDHDPQSRAFPFVRADDRSHVSVLWNVAVPTLDQGSLSSCVGNAGTHRLAAYDGHGAGQSTVVTAGVAWKLNEPYAVDLYAAATRRDDDPRSYPPDDVGTTGLALAKELTARGLLRGPYRWCFGLEQALDGLQDGPVLFGTNWYDRMFSPDARGLVTIGGGLVGGHEYLVVGVDVARREVICLNSWGDGWGLTLAAVTQDMGLPAVAGDEGRGGLFRMSFDTAATLLDADGDALVLDVVKTNTEPQPTPPQPAPGGEGWFRLPADLAAAVHRAAVRRGVTDTEELELVLRAIFHLTRTLTGEGL